MNERHLTDAALTVLATARLTRFVTTDDVPGQWWIKDPLETLAHRHSHTVPRTPGRLGGPVSEVIPPRWARYLEGLSCPWCCGTYVAFGVVAVDALTHGTKAERPWRLFKTALAVNAVMVPAGKAVEFWE